MCGIHWTMGIWIHDNLDWSSSLFFPFHLSFSDGESEAKVSPARTLAFPGQPPRSWSSPSGSLPRQSELSDYPPSTSAPTASPVVPFWQNIPTRITLARVSPGLNQTCLASKLMWRSQQHPSHHFRHSFSAHQSLGSKSPSIESDWCTKTNQGGNRCFG